MGLTLRRERYRRGGSGRSVNMCPQRVFSITAGVPQPCQNTYKTPGPFSVCLHTPQVQAEATIMLSSSWLVVFATLAWIIWRLFSRFLLKSPLDNIPGPPRSSILRGTAYNYGRASSQLMFPTGNFGDLFNRHAWDFFDNISRAYGPVLKLHGALGVCSDLSTVFIISSLNFTSQGYYMYMIRRLSTASS